MFKTHTLGQAQKRGRPESTGSLKLRTYGINMLESPILRWKCPIDRQGAQYISGITRRMDDSVEPAGPHVVLSWGSGPSRIHQRAIVPSGVSRANRGDAGQRSNARPHVSQLYEADIP